MSKRSENDGSVPESEWRDHEMRASVEGRARHDRTLLTDRPEWIGEDALASWREDESLGELRDRVLQVAARLPRGQRNVNETDRSRRGDNRVEEARVAASRPTTRVNLPLLERKGTEMRATEMRQVSVMAAGLRRMTTSLGVTVACLFLSESAGASVAVVGMPTDTLLRDAVELEGVAAEAASGKAFRAARGTTEVAMPCPVQEVEIELECTFEGSIKYKDGEVCAKGKISCTGEGISGSIDVDRCFSLGEN